MRFAFGHEEASDSAMRRVRIRVSVCMVEESISEVGMSRSDSRRKGSGKGWHPENGYEDIWTMVFVHISELGKRAEVVCRDVCSGILLA